MKLLLCPPDGNHDIGWQCDQCGKSTYYPLSKTEQRIFNCGMKWGEENKSDLIRDGQRLRKIKELLSDL
jgi:hypothetical protein